jgi:hypothetical protein
MTLKTFIDLYDHEQSVILLAGKRAVVEQDRAQLVVLARLLASSTQDMIFRSGNAPGADQYFSEGIAEISQRRLQVITPYTNHRKKTNLAYETISVENINLAEEPEIVYQSKKNKNTEKLIDQYVLGDKNQYSIKAAYIIRDTIMVIGSKAVKPANFGIFYDDLQNTGTGGTGHTMQICAINKIPFIDQCTWLSWLDEVNEEK